MQVYNCKTCTKKEKKQRGCIRPFKNKVIWTIDECVYCEGKNKNCIYCKGKGKIFVRQCPRAMSKCSYLLPYFIAYRHSNGLVWPDGRGRLYQPKKLVDAFDILGYYFAKHEEKQQSKVMENVGKIKSRINSIK